jgi:hypothetical protein
VSNLMLHERMKHAEVDYHFVRDRDLKKLLDVQFVSTDDQVTKVLSQGSLAIST